MERTVVNIKNKYAEAIRNRIRDKNTPSTILKKSLEVLGNIVGQEIAMKYFLEEKTVNTPTGFDFTGDQLSSEQIVIVSTLDDYGCFGKGIADSFLNVKRGYLDFAGIRGPEALTSPLRSITLPDINNNDVDTLIIAKSVLATGCTAISLTRKAIEKYWPQRLIIATVFYSIKGYSEVQSTCKTATIFTIGQPEELRSDGILIPGFGDLDKRLNEVTY